MIGLRILASKYSPFCLPSARCSRGIRTRWTRQEEPSISSVGRAVSPALAPCCRRKRKPARRAGTGARVLRVIRRRFPSCFLLVRSLCFFSLWRWLFGMPRRDTAEGCARLEAVLSTDRLCAFCSNPARGWRTPCMVVDTGRDREGLRVESSRPIWRLHIPELRLILSGRVSC